MTRSRTLSCSRSRREGYLGTTSVSDSSLGGYDSPDTLRLRREGGFSLRKCGGGTTFATWRFSRELLRCRSADPERNEVNLDLISAGRLLLRTSSDRISLRWVRIGTGGVTGVATGIRRTDEGGGMGPGGRDLELGWGCTSTSESEGETE